jgi:hypothetical protein
MTFSLDKPDRTFQMWAFTVSMGQLVLRSTKSEHFETRIDVKFQDVRALQLPTILVGLTIRESGSIEASLVAKNADLPPGLGGTVFSVEGSNYSGYVVAGVVATSEDDGDYSEPSELWPALPGPLRGL